MNTFLGNGDLYISEIQYKTSDYRSLCMWTCYLNLHVLLRNYVYCEKRYTNKCELN